MIRVLRDLRSASAAAQRSAAQLEPRVADRGDLVHKIAIEFDCHRQPEAEARLHAGGIGPHRQIEMVPEVGKMLDEVDDPADLRAIDPGHERDIFPACHQRMEAAREAERPGRPDVLADLAGVGQLGTGDQAQGGGFAGTVRAEDAVSPARVDAHRGVVEHHLLVAVGDIDFCHVMQMDHGRDPIIIRSCGRTGSLPREFRSNREPRPRVTPPGRARSGSWAMPHRGGGAA
jgi:hypothetical protein